MDHSHELDTIQISDYAVQETIIVTLINGLDVAIITLVANSGAHSL